MSTTTTGLSELSLVTIMAPEQDAAIDFYVNKLGFEKRTDVPFGDKYRWVEVYPPNGTAGIALAPPPPGREFVASETGITLSTADIEATHATLKDAGVDVDADISRMGDPIPPMFWLRDNHGHTLLVVESA